MFQNYLKSINYSNVIVGHAKKIRYNTGNWPETKFGDDLLEREKKMIEYCDYAIIIWVNNSGVIGKNLELLKKLSKPTFIYEYNTKSKERKFSSIDKNRKYSSLY